MSQSGSAGGVSAKRVAKRRHCFENRSDAGLRVCMFFFFLYCISSDTPRFLAVENKRNDGQYSEVNCVFFWLAKAFNGVVVKSRLR